MCSVGFILFFSLISVVSLLSVLALVSIVLIELFVLVQRFCFIFSLMASLFLSAVPFPHFLSIAPECIQTGKAMNTISTK